MKKGKVQFIAGLLVGMAIFSCTGVAGAVVEVLTATPSTQTFYVGGEQVSLTAYSINGYNFVKLRDIGQAVGFNVYYDAANDAAVLEPDEPYTGEPPQSKPAEQDPAETDYASDVDPSIFTNELTSGIFNVLRDTVVHRAEILNGTYASTAIDRTQEVKTAMTALTAAMGNYPTYQVITPEAGKLSCTVKVTSAYDDAITHTQSFMDSIAQNSQREQVEQIVWYISDRMTYSTAVASPATILAGDEVIPGRCMSYAHCFTFLCGRANIPCILVSSDIHQWNKVYVDGQWWDVDVTGLDSGDDTTHRQLATILCGPGILQGSIYTDNTPEQTRFLQEILVPGSTK